MSPPQLRGPSSLKFSSVQPLFFKTVKRPTPQSPTALTSRQCLCRSRIHDFARFSLGVSCVLFPSSWELPRFLMQRANLTCCLLVASNTLLGRWRSCRSLRLGDLVVTPATIAMEGLLVV